jgi:hypothetical protein
MNNIFPIMSIFPFRKLIIITVQTFQASPPPPTGHSLPGPALGIVILIFFVPVFLLVNFGSVFLGLLGGMLGGVLRSLC